MKSHFYHAFIFAYVWGFALGFAFRDGMIICTLMLIALWIFSNKLEVIMFRSRFNNIDRNIKNKKNK